MNPEMILTIDPGAQLVFQQNKGMSIGGALKARGTGSAPVLLTGEVKQNGSWGGVLFYNPTMWIMYWTMSLLSMVAVGKSWQTWFCSRINSTSPFM